MSEYETEQLWTAVETLTNVIIDLTSVTVQAAPDAKSLKHLKPIFEELRELSRVFAEHYQTDDGEKGKADDVSSTDVFLHHRISELEETLADQARERERPVVIHLKRAGND